MIASLPNFEQKVQDLKKQIEELTLAARTNERQRMMLMKTLAGSLNEVQSGREVVMRMLLRVSLRKHAWSNAYTDYV